MKENIKIIDSNNTYIDDTVSIGEGCIIYPGVELRGNTVIGDNTIIDSHTIIEQMPLKIVKLVLIISLVQVHIFILIL